MRLDADRHHAGSARFTLALALALASSVACSKTWVLGAGAQGGTAPSGAGGGGGTTSPRGTGGAPGFGGHGEQGGGGHGSGSCTPSGMLPSNFPTAELVFVVGRNYSMGSKFADGTRLTSVEMAVHDMVSANGGTVDFGYQGFPSLTGCASGTCCVSSDDRVHTMPVAAHAIDTALSFPCDQSASGTGCVAPTDSRAVSQALSSVVDVFDSNPDPSNDRYVVLVTDGPPGCPAEDPMKACTAAQTAMTTLAKDGFKTYIVAVGDAAQDDPCLKSLAMQGATLYGAVDSTSLAKSLGMIASVATVTPCTLELKFPPNDPTLVSVELQGRGEIHYDPTGSSGWSYVFVGPSVARIELHGKSCLLLQNNRSPLTVLTGCPPCTVPSGNCL